MAAKMCRKPGCRGIVRENVCSGCGPVAVAGWLDDRERGTRQERGYDDAWVALRNSFVEEERIKNGGICVCSLCDMPILERKDEHVDHIRRFRGLNDPLRLDRRNLRVAHLSCHMAKTARDSHHNR